MFSEGVKNTFPFGVIVCIFYNSAWAAVIWIFWAFLLLGDMPKRKVSFFQLILFVAVFICCFFISRMQADAWRSMIMNNGDYITVVHARTPRAFINANANIIPWYARGALVLYRKGDEGDAIGYIFNFPSMRSQINFDKRTMDEMN